jgi:hypothetical protein
MISTADFDSASPSLNLGSSTCTKSWNKLIDLIKNVLEIK